MTFLGATKFVVGATKFVVGATKFVVGATKFVVGLGRRFGSRIISRNFWQIAGYICWKITGQFMANFLTYFRSSCFCLTSAATRSTTLFVTAGVQAPQLFTKLFIKSVKSLPA
jgi:hypothetical protein